jgi:RNA polymerase sigma factor (sigma-70 family)
MDEWAPTRATLISRLKDWQDQVSWQDFFDTYGRLLYGVALKAGLSVVEAQDVVQETMIAVARHMPDFKYGPAVGSFRAWLLNLTRWRIRDRRRWLGPLAASEPLPGDPVTETSTTETPVDPATYEFEVYWDKEWARNLLDAAVSKVRRKVDPQKYQIFDLYVNKDWTPEKVAAAFGIPVSQVYLARHRVTTMIKDEVERLEREMI